jgi:hypothetical protein
VFIKFDNEFLEYSGRIDHEPDKTIFIFPCSYVKIRIYGRNITAVVDNKNNYWDNYIGVFVDGKEIKHKLSNEGGIQKIILVDDVGPKEHEVMLFKRQDSCHELGFYGFEVDDTAELLSLPPKESRKIEVYGDSVSAGEVSEAEGYEGKHDPQWHQGELSNSYYSYAWLTARKLNAQIHDVAQGGIALLDNTGWFNEPDYLGMESVYDKVRYNPAFGEHTKWDFKKYTPDVVVVAIGQNDSHPTDYMADSYSCEKANEWRDSYKAFILKLRDIYPDANIVLITTILQHNVNWDNSIHQVWQELSDPKVHHFLFKQNGVGTPGHIRKSEAEQMADELSQFINGLDIEAWR